MLEAEQKKLAVIDWEPSPNHSVTLINGEFYLLKFNIIIQCPLHIRETQANNVN
jgi:hypothetical protein